jgi:hypothetical protein
LRIDCRQIVLAYLAASDALIKQATKEEVAEVERALALHVAHYRQRFGDVSIEDFLEMPRTERVNDEQAKEFADGLGALVEVLNASGTLGVGAVKGPCLLGGCV